MGLLSLFGRYRNRRSEIKKTISNLTNGVEDGDSLEEAKAKIRDNFSEIRGGMQDAHHFKVYQLKTRLETLRSNGAQRIAEIQEQERRRKEEVRIKLLEQFPELRRRE